MADYMYDTVITFVFNALEGILESTDAEGIDRKDVFFYQVYRCRSNAVYI